MFAIPASIYECYDWTGESEATCKRDDGSYKTGITCKEFCKGKTFCKIK